MHSSVCSLWQYVISFLMSRHAFFLSSDLHTFEEVVVSQGWGAHPKARENIAS